MFNARNSAEILTTLMLAQFLTAGDATTQSSLGSQQSSVSVIASSSVLSSSSGNSAKPLPGNRASTCSLIVRPGSSGAIVSPAFLQGGCFGCYIELVLAAECVADPTCNIYGCSGTGDLPRRGCNAQQPLPSWCSSEGCPGETDKYCYNPDCV